MVKKLTIFMIFVLVGLATFLAGYLVTRNINPANQQALINNSLVERFNKTEEKYVEPTGLFALTAGEASFPVLSADGKEIWYYVPRSGEIRSVVIRDSSSSSTLLAKIQPQASMISWGLNKTLVATYSTGSIYYDLASNFSKKYGAEIKNPVLNRAGTKIAYTYFNSETREGDVTIADPKLESYKNIMPTRFADWQMAWVNNDKLALTKPPTLDNTTTSLFLLNTESRELQNILGYKNNLEVSWSPSGQNILYSYADPATNQNNLYLMSLSDKEELPLKLAYYASGCAWSMDNKTVYCADKNSFVHFDATAATVETSAVSESQTNTFSATSPFLTSTEDYLIFKNSKDGKLYGLSLTQ